MTAAARLARLEKRIAQLASSGICLTCGYPGNPLKPHPLVLLKGQEPGKCWDCGRPVDGQGRAVTGKLYEFARHAPADLFQGAGTMTGADAGLERIPRAELQVPVYVLRGGNEELWHARDPEVLIEGPAGTGKSMSVGHYLYRCMQRWPGIRVLAVRQTRASLSESWLVTWEEKVLRVTDAYMLDGATRENRHHYAMRNGSILVPGGLDNASRYYSTEWDIVFVEEAFEVAEDAFERFGRALRNWQMPYQQLIAATNPDSEDHWLNKRPLSGYCDVCEELVLVA